MNSVQLSGRLAKDAEIKQTKNSKEFIIITIATDGLANEKGERKSDFHRCVVFGKLAADNKGLKKGASVFAEGSISYGTYEKNGQTMYSTNITLNTLIGQVAQNNPETSQSVEDDGIPSEWK